MGRRATGTVEARQGCIRLKFTHAGVRYVERLDLKPTPPNIKAAERLLGRIQGAITAGVYRREDFFQDERGGRAVTFAAYVDEWAATLTVEKSTRRSYLSSVRAVWTPTLGELALAQVRYSDVKRTIAARKAAGVSGKTLNNALIPLRLMFKLAIADGLVTQDPTDGISNLPHQKPPPDPLTQPEKETVLAHMAKRYPGQVHNYFDFAFHTGIRPSEQILLRWEDIDWNLGTARVERARVEGVDKDTKTHMVRDIELNARALAALERQKPLTFMKGGAVFENPVTGRAWNNAQKQRINYWNPTLKALGIRGRDAYQTRHTFATAMLMIGANPAWIARQLGHRSAQMLFKVYAKWIDRADRGAELDKVNQALGAAAKGNTG